MDAGQQPLGIARKLTCTDKSAVVDHIDNLLHRAQALLIVL